MLNAVRIWILFSTLLVAAGWILSALHELNRAGYGVVFALAAIATVFWQRKTGWKPEKNFRQLLHKFKNRFKRPAPAIFLVLAIASFAGGALYFCTDLDSNAYRTPRVLHWLGQQQWHWIYTDDPRMNIADCGFEWLSAPLILFSRTDRLIFLINLGSFLMLPGLVFSLFARLGVRPRVAWWWMWFLSAGWCYAMQAGSFHNDSFATVYALAAVDLALRAREKNSLFDFSLSLLAAALLTGAKQTDILLILLWLIAAWPSLRFLKTNFAMISTAIFFGVIVSATPIIFFNWQHSGTWTGLSPDSHWLRTQLNSPFWGLAGNTFALTAQNLLPPFFPWSNSWDAAMSRFVQTPFGTHFASFEQFAYLNPGITEKNAGIGLGLCVFVLISCCAIYFLKPKAAAKKIQVKDKTILLLRWTPLLLLVLFMAKVGSFQNARLLSPYYVFFFPALLSRPGFAILARKRWWQWAGLLTMLLALFTLAIIRSRPLFPAITILTPLHQAHPESKIISQAWKSYSNRLSLEAIRNCFKNSMPTDEKVIGYATYEGAIEPSLWLPFGQRTVWRVLPQDTPLQLAKQNIHFVVVEESSLIHANETIEQWLSQYDGVIVDRFEVQYGPYRPQEPLYLVKLKNFPTP